MTDSSKIIPDLPTGKHKLSVFVDHIKAQPGWKAQIFKGLRLGYDANPDDLVESREVLDCMLPYGSFIRGQILSLWILYKNHPTMIIKREK